MPVGGGLHHLFGAAGVPDRWSGEGRVLSREQPELGQVGGVLSFSAGPAVSGQGGREYMLVGIQGPWEGESGGGSDG